MVRLALPLLVACGDSNDSNSDQTCDALGVEQTLDGTVAVPHDACVVSDTVASSDTLTSYIARVTPIGQRERLLHERCYGVEDNGVYDRVAHSYDMSESGWTQDEGIFAADGSIVWFATSSHATACSGEDAVCDTCCAQYCCAGEPVSASGTGDPVPLRDCVLVSEQ